jgi:hypothetical protein
MMINRCNSGWTIWAAKWVLLPVLWPGFALTQPVFTEVSESIGIRQLTISFDLMGGGCAFFDFNNDGFEDHIVVGGANQDLLFKNNGDGTFTDITAFAGLNNDDLFKTTGVVTGDINNDGLRDIFITTEDLDANVLYLNNGNGTFSNISKNAGFTTKVWSSGAAFGDFNRDGWLDLYVINYIDISSTIEDSEGNTIGFDHTCFPDQLYINNGDLTFTEVTLDYGIDNPGCGLAVAFTDYNGDQVPDIYIANDFGQWIVPNIMYKNNYPELLFEDASASTGLDAKMFGMGIAVGDYDRDGLVDYYITNIGRNFLFRNMGDGSYADRTDEAGVVCDIVPANGLNSTGWGTAFFDYDLDGYEDLFVSNGYIPSAKFIETSDIDPNHLYRNNGDGTFEDVSAASGVNDAGISRGMAVADFDNDGDLDLSVTKLGQIRDSQGNMLFYRNELNSDFHWLKVKLEGVTSNRDAFGARIKAYSNQICWTREIDGGSSHASQNSSIAHFGLGPYDQLDSLVVLWPTGGRQVFESIEADQTLYIKEHEFAPSRAGCTDTEADNYDATATYNFGCVKRIRGCTDPEAVNFMLEANMDDGSCTYTMQVEGCTDPEASNYNPSATVDDGSCTYVTGLGEDKHDTGVIAYPNPTPNSCVLMWKGTRSGSVTVTDFSGRLITFIPHFVGNSVTIDHHGMSNGMYLYEVAFEDGNKVVGKILFE